MENLETMINNLLASDDESIKKGSDELQECFKNPETIGHLCDIVVSSKDAPIRQYAAVLLRKRLNKLRHWQQVDPERRAIIKKGMLNALIQEQLKPVRNVIAQFVGVLIRHEAEDKDPWMEEVLRYLYSQCSSPDPIASEVGSGVFCTLTESAPDQFVPYMENICDMFSHALMATEQQNAYSSVTIYNIILGMNYLVPFILGLNSAEQTYQKSIPLIVKCLQSLAVDYPERFCNEFEILENIADYTPKLLTMNLKLLMEFCLEMSSNTALHNTVRVRTVSYIGWLVRLKKKLVVKQKMVEPILAVVFNLMATEPENDADDDEDYFSGAEGSNPMTTATQTMDLLALNIPPEKMIPPLLAYLEPALRGEDPLPRRAAYLSMAVIAEGCSDAICNKYLETMLNIIKVGIVDKVPLVRNAAFFALGQFSEHLQPEISNYAPQILPILFEFLFELCKELRNGGAEPKHIDRMFYALETFCENLGSALVPHLPLLMERLFEAMGPTSSVHVRELSLSAISAAANAAKENMMPYFEKLVIMLQGYLVRTTNDDILSLRTHAVDTLAAIARSVGPANFLPLANDAMSFALALINETEDPDMRRSIYNLLASLASVVGHEMSGVYPKILDRIYDSVLSTEESGEKRPAEAGDDEHIEAKESDDIDDIDIEFSDNEEDVSDNIGFTIENAFLDEKEEAILALKEFAEHTGPAFMPYVETAFKHVFKVIDHPEEDIRKVAIDALTVFVFALYQNDNIIGAAEAINILVPKLSMIVREDEEISVVLVTLESFSDLLGNLKHVAVGNPEIRDHIFSCVYDVMMGRILCQFEEQGVAPDDTENDISEFDNAIVEAAGDILPLFGNAMEPAEFDVYLQRIYLLLIHKWQTFKKHESLQGQRAFIYGCVGECFRPLKQFSANYFDVFFPILIDGLSDEFDQARQNAIFGLGELVINAGSKSYEAYPRILAHLSNVVLVEKAPRCLDNICGAIARVIMNNPALVPLDQVMPVFMQILPIREDFDENDTVLQCFKMLYIKNRECLLEHSNKILAVTFKVLLNKEFQNKETEQDAIGLLKEFRANYADKFNEFKSTNPDAVPILETL